MYLFLCMAVRQLWKEEERDRIRGVQMNDLVGLLGIGGDG